MLKVSHNITGLINLQKEINRVNKILETQKDINNFIKEKVKQTLNEVMSDELKGGTTNDEAISLYISSNQIEDTSNGFILYNNATIDANTKEKSTYPNGQFSIALAFEYGVGIIGQNTPDPYNKAWDYNVNNYNFGWTFKNSKGEVVSTAGYMGFEIYRKVADKVNKNLSSWYKEYWKDEGGK